MATLTVWKYDTDTAASQALTTLESLQKQELITIVDAAVVSWPADKKKPKTDQYYNTTGAGALGGAFWGMLFGLIFFIPLIGTAIGAAMGAITGALTDVGIDDDFIKTVQKEVTAGTSALFLMSEGAVADKVEEAIGDNKGQLIASNLSTEQEQALSEVFGA